MSSACVHYRTIIMSDIHIGASYSESLWFSRFLQNHSCDKLILNGDIIDEKFIRRYGSYGLETDKNRVFVHALQHQADSGAEMGGGGAQGGCRV